MGRTIAFVAALLFAGAGFCGEIFVQSLHPISKRIAVLEDNEQVAYLYLTKPQTQRPDKDALVYSRGKLVEKVEWASIAKSGEPPLLARNIMSTRAIIAAPGAAEFSFRWSTDGHAVALLRNGEPIAFASATDKYGYSKAVAVSSALANAWDQRRYEEVFGR